MARRERSTGASGARFRPWGNRDFGLFWAGHTVSFFGDHLFIFAVTLWTLETTGSSLSATGVLAASAVAGGLAGPIGGVVADRMDRRRILLGTSVAYVLATAIGGALLLAGRLTLPGLYGLAVVVALVDQFHLAAGGAAVPNLVDRNELTAANGFIETSRAVTGVVAPALGGIFIATYSVGWLLIADAVTFLANLLALVAIRRTFQRSNQGDGRKAWYADLAEGLRTAWSDRRLLALLVVIAAVTFAMAPMVVLVPATILRQFGLGPGEAGVASGVFAGGVLFGSQVLSWRRPRSGLVRLVALGLLLGGAGNLVFALSPSFALALVGTALAGVATITVIIGIRTLLQLSVPDRMLGRLMSLRQVLPTVTRPLGLFAGGGLAQALSPRGSIGVFGLLFLVCAAGVLASSRLRALEDSSPGEPVFA